MRSLPAASLVLVAAVTAACSRGDAPSSPPAPRPPAPLAPEAVASALHVDAAAVLESPLDPPAPPGDLRADIDAFTTLDACVQQRATLDPLVGDAIHAIGYETFLRDACRLLGAAKTKDARQCEAIDAAPLRARCQMLVAVLLGDADACPFYVPLRPAMGREPMCLATAARDARLCAAAEPFERAECEGLASGDVKACASISHDAERALCGREVERWSTVLPPPAEGRRAFAAPSGKLVIHRPAKETPEAIDADIEAAVPAVPAARDVDVDLAAELARGLVLVEQADGTHVDVGTIREEGPSIYANPPLAWPHIGLTLVLGPANRLVHADHCELALPNEPTHTSPGAPCSVDLTVDKLDATRGGVARFTARGSIDLYSFELTVSTFVRDVVNRASLAGKR